MKSSSFFNLRVATLWFCCLFISQVDSFVPTIHDASRAATAHRHPKRFELYGSKKNGPKKQSSKGKANHEKWQPYFDRLSHFKDQHGHCDVKEEDDPALFEWVQDQHRSYQALQMGRKTKLTKKRAVALEQLGVMSSIDATGELL